jgi:hypothetical protein
MFDEGFGGLGIPGPARRRAISADVLLHYLDTTDEKAVLLTNRGSVVLSTDGAVLVDTLPVVVPNAAGSIYSNDSGYERILTHVSVVNVSGSAVSLQLYMDVQIGNVPTDSDTWGAPGLDIPADGGVWEWTGRWPIRNGYMLAGVAGAADSLYAIVGIEGGQGEFPWHEE